MTEVLPQPWRDKAACRDYPNPEDWFPTKGVAPIAYARLRPVCASCTVQPECEAFILECEATGSFRVGFWAGYTPKERQALVSARKKAARQEKKEATCR